jgi:hypothetical protein
MVGILLRQVNSGIATDLKTEGLRGLCQITDFLASKTEQSTAVQRRVGMLKRL